MAQCFPCVGLVTSRVAFNQQLVLINCPRCFQDPLPTAADSQARVLTRMKAGYKSKLSQKKSGVPASDACAVRAGIRDHVVQSVELKFNCFFLMPIVDAFPTRLRTDLEAAYEEDLDDVFDVAAVRAALEGRLRSLETELHQVSQLSH